MSALSLYVDGRFVVDVRPGPSANVVLVRGERPLLVDAGSGTVGSDARVAELLAAHGVAPRELRWLVLTHFHGDHAGGAALLQRDHGVPVAAHALEAEMVNARDPEVCDGRFLAFPVGPYTVDRALADGEPVAEAGVEVVHTPGQTPGHIALWDPRARTALTGDLLSAGDVSWIPYGRPWSDGALERTVAAVERIAALRPRLVVPGHGPPVTDVPAAVAAALARYERFAREPALAVGHAVRRAVVAHLMGGPMTLGELLAQPWAQAAGAASGEPPEDVLGAALRRLVERGPVVVDDDGRYRTVVPHEPPGAASVGPGDPREWPPANQT